MHKDQDISRAHVDYVLGNYLTRLRIATQTNCKPVEVHFTFGQPPSETEYGRIFGGRLRFRQPINRMLFPREVMEMALPLANPELSEVLEDYAQRRLKNLVHGSTPLVEIQNAIARIWELGS